MANNVLKLSPSTLNLFRDCERCFYLELKKISGRPRGIFPSLPIGMDSILKKYYETFRAKGELPPELKGHIKGKLALGLPKQLKFFDEKLNAELRGNLDECIEFSDSTFAPLDFKTRASKAEEVIEAYQNQMNIYSLLLEGTGHKPKGVAYLVYYFPESAEGENIKFGIDIKEISTSLADAHKLFSDAVKLLGLDKIPEADPECEYCNFEKSRSMV